MCSVKKNSGVAYCDSEDIELDDFLKTVGESLKERLSAPSIIQEQMETLAKNSEEHVAREKDRQALKAKRLKEIDQEKANLMRGLAKAEEEFPENVQDFNQSLSRLNKEKEQINQQQQDMDEETSELMAFLADPEGVLEALQELGDSIDPDDLEVTSRFLKSIVNLVEVSDDDAEMYYSVPLPNTVETTAGYKAPARIKRAGHSLLLGISDPPDGDPPELFYPTALRATTTPVAGEPPPWATTQDTAVAGTASATAARPDGPQTGPQCAHTGQCPM